MALRKTLRKVLGCHDVGGVVTMTRIAEVAQVSPPRINRKPRDRFGMAVRRKAVNAQFDVRRDDAELTPGRSTRLAVPRHFL